MSVLSRLGAAVRRADPVTLEEFGYLLGRRQSNQSHSGIEVSETGAMGITAWYSGVVYLSTAVAFLPVKAYRRTGDERTQRPLPLWLQTPDKDPISGIVNLTRGQLLEQWMVALLNRGNSFGWKLRDNVDRVTGMRFLHNDRVEVFSNDRTGEKRFRVKSNGMGTVVAEHATAREVFHLVGHGSDGVMGKSPIRLHAEALGIAAAQNQLTARYFRDGTLIRDYVKVPPENTQDPKLLKEVVQEFHQGLNNAHELAVLRGGSYETVDLKAEDAELLESRRWSTVEMAQILRIPPHKLYELSRSTFSNIEHQSIESVIDSIRPRVGRIEDQVNADQSLVTGNDFIEFSLEGLLRGDTKTRYEAYHLGIQDGWMELSDPRRKENLPPRPGMDVVYRPANMHVVDTATGQVVIPAGAPTDDASDDSDEEAIDGSTSADVAETLRLVASD